MDAPKWERNMHTCKKYNPVLCHTVLASGGMSRRVSERFNNVDCSNDYIT
jgi:hypothetical protein